MDYLDSDVREPATRDALVSELGVKPARLRRNIKAQQPFFMNGAFQFQIAQVLLDRGSKKADLQLWRDFCRSALWYSYEEVKAVGCVMLQRLIDGEKAEKIQREVSCCFTVKKSRFLAYNPKIKNKARKSQSVGYNSNNSNNYNNYNNNNPRSRDFVVKGGTQRSQKICRGFNFKPPCTYTPCKFNHVCSQCGGNHGYQDCPLNKSDKKCGDTN